MTTLSCLVPALCITAFGCATPPSRAQVAVPHDEPAAAEVAAADSFMSRYALGDPSAAAFTMADTAVDFWAGFEEAIRLPLARAWMRHRTITGISAEQHDVHWVFATLDSRLRADSCYSSLTPTDTAMLEMGLIGTRWVVRRIVAPLC